MVVSTAEAGSKRPEGFAVARGQSFLQGRATMIHSSDEVNNLYPFIGKGEISTVHFIMNHKRYCELGRHG